MFFNKREIPFVKRIAAFFMCGLLVFSTMFSQCLVKSNAASFGGWAKNALVSAVQSGAYSAGFAIGTSVGGPAMGSVLGGLSSVTANYFLNPSESGTSGNINYSIMNGDIYNINNSFNTTNYYSYYDESYNDYSNTYNYSFYNPINNNYNTTNNFYYNPEYNTCYYTTNEGDTTTNYYVTDNTTHVSYYIVEKSDSETISEMYFEIYYRLPDGRNSYNLTADKIKGEYFLSSYTTYQKVAEDDGKTLGLWHLDGDLKDSSYWGNSAGSSYTSTYNDAKFDGGKYLSTSSGDYFTLPLDNVSLPSSWTLEWVQYVPDESKTYTKNTDSKVQTRVQVETEPTYVYSDYLGYGIGTAGKKNVYYDVKETNTYYLYTGASGISGESILCRPRTKSLEHYAIVYDGGSYSYYVNGVLTSCEPDNFIGGGITISDSEIRFYVGSNTETGDYSLFLENLFIQENSSVGFNPTSSYFTDDNYFIYAYGNYYTRNKYITYFNRNSIFDEIRLSKGAIYTSNFTPSSQPYTTNTVLVTPEEASENEIAFKTDVSVGDVRIGGVRSTYPNSGDVYVSLTDAGKVEKIQQYQTNGWYSIDAAIYDGERWNSLIDFDMSSLQLEEDSGKSDTIDSCSISANNTAEGIVFTASHTVTCSQSSSVCINDTVYDINDSFIYTDAIDSSVYRIKMTCLHTIDGTVHLDSTDEFLWTYYVDGTNKEPVPVPDDTENENNPDEENEDNGSIWGKIGSLLAKFLDIISSLLSPLIDGIISLIDSVISSITHIMDFTGSFGSFLSSAFEFIPSEIISIYALGVSLVIIAIIIKIFKG